MSFAENLRDALELANLKQVDLAKRTGINIKSIESYIKSNATTIPSADKAVKIAKTLGVTVEELVNGKKSPNAAYHNKKMLDTLSKLNEYNCKVIAALASALLALQAKNTAT